ncbi:MAG: TIM barrel protein [Oscillospiraceae bacterium]|nr:TIM barrel protein [Oscillospiraceae bacterium]
MRYCVPVPCFFGKEDFCEAIRKIGALGFDCAETYGWKNLDLDAVRAACEESGVELLSMCTTEFNMTGAGSQEKWLAGLRESCAAAKKVGASRLITQVGPDTGEDRALQHARIVETLRAAKPILEESGIIIMIEPLNTYVNHPGYYLWSSKEAFDIIREVDHPLVKVVYDIYHQQIMEGNIIPSVTGNLDCIAHLHSAGHPGRHELQFGENDYHVIFDAIDKSGYTGACGLEYMPTMDPVESLKEFRRIYMGE